LLTIQPAPRVHHWHGGPPPMYQPRFTEAQLTEARRVVGQRKALHAERQRARLVLLLHGQPAISSPEAARRLGQSVSWVRNWRRRWTQEGFTLSEAKRSGRPHRFLDWMRALVIAIACELPAQRGLSLSRHFASSICRVVNGEGVSMSVRTVRRILAKDHLKPWRYRSWMHPRDPEFVPKLKRILGLYEGVWEGQPLGPHDQVLSADEKTSIQARQHQVVGPAPGRPGLVESDYKRRGALQYLCAWDVRRGVPWGRCVPKIGIDPFMALVDQVMSMEPYRWAPRVFWIVDNGSSHQGPKAAERLRRRYPNAILVHTPVHASWVNQVEIFFSIIQRKVLTPAVADSLGELAARILGFEADYRSIPRPVRWLFTRKEFDRRLEELDHVKALAA
jgi:transposase